MKQTTKPKISSLIRNWTSMVGIAFASTGIISGLVLITMDIIQHFKNPYIGIFTYMVIPMVIITGFIFILGGILRERRRRAKNQHVTSRMPRIDLNNHRHFIAFNVVVFVVFVFFSLSAVGSYRAYHFTESVTFCGETCHDVMKPEYTAYQGSPHANAGCTSCHIGPGADFFVKAKVNGLYQVYSTIFGKYNRPIAAPVHNLRPAKETCYTCHWPSKFFSSVEMNRTYFRGDEENSPWTIRMLIKVGGGDKDNGRAQGIHWQHASNNNTIEYIATDEKRMDIPWIRVTDSDGKQTIFQSADTDKQLTEEQVASATIRTMDCIDCHNRPTHQYHSPEQALNESLSTDRLDASLPNIKAVACEVLTEDYETEAEALAAIKDALMEEYPEGGPNVEQAIQETQNIFSRNIFPEMKVSWKAYPDHIGHMITPGCFRCHNGDHENEEGKVITRDCDTCHTIIAQGPGRNPESISSTGLPFQHPEDIDEEWKETMCSDCHEGVPVM